MTTTSDLFARISLLLSECLPPFGPVLEQALEPAPVTRSLGVPLIELERDALLSLNQRQATTIHLLRGALVKLVVHLYTPELLRAMPDAVVTELVTALHRDSCTLNTLEVRELQRTLMGGC